MFSISYLKAFLFRHMAVAKRDFKFDGIE